MAKKIIVRKRRTSEFQKIEKEVEKDVKEVEKWIIERKKFFIKLGIIVLFILLLLAYSHFLTQ